MNIFKWSDEYDVGKKGLNDEHKQIIDLMNKLHTLNESAAAKEEISANIANLIKIAAQHFRDEEEYMRSIQYPDYDRHKQVHEELMLQLTEQKKAFESWDSGELTDAFFSFLRFWFFSHIQFMDKDYYKFAQSKA